jgi:geranylgeranylglycerol-phosphate geranylgeranyltransferase
MHERFKDLVSLIRPVNGIMAAIAVVVGFIVAGGTTAPLGLAFAALSAFFILGAGMAVNDWADYDIDRRLKPHRPVASGRIKRGHALTLSVALFAAGVILAALVNLAAFLIAVAASVLLAAYAVRLSRMPVLGNAAVALLTGLTFWFGEAVRGFVFSPEVSMLALLALFSTFAREIYKSIHDMEADKRVRRTLPMLVGVKTSALIAGVSLALAIAVSPVPYWIGTFGTNYILLITLVDAGFLYTLITGLLNKDHLQFAKQARFVKVFQFAALIAFLAGV